MARADHVRVRLFWKNVMPYWHHGIDMGDGTVVHFTSGLPLADELGSSTNALVSDRERLEAMEIRRTSIQEFSGGNPLLQELGGEASQVHGESNHIHILCKPCRVQDTQLNPCPKEACQVLCLCTHQELVQQVKAGPNIGP